MGNHGHLSIGIKGSMGYYNASLTEVKVWDQRDKVFAQDVLNRWIPNAGAGIYYYLPNFYAGISVPSLINYSKPSAEVAAQITAIPNYQRHYFLTSGYVIALDNDVYIKPSTLLKYTKDAPLEADFNLNVFFLNRINLGGGYRTKDGLVAMAELYVTPNLRLGYAYDYPLTDINMFSTGSHELMVSYDFKHTFTKVKTPRFF
jgi:type IX secretion system PorP/SprF family membrane protein